MARPTSKTDLMQAAAANWQKLNDFVAGLTEAELAAPFYFSADEKKKEAHWRRDKNLRDVLIHLWEWHQLLLKWVQANQAGEERPFFARALQLENLRPNEPGVLGAAPEHQFGGGTGDAGAVPRGGAGLG